MSFSDQLKQSRIALINETEEYRQGITIKLFNSVIADTPVNTGRARANWQTTEGNPAEGTLSETNQIPVGRDGGTAQQRVVDFVTQSKPDTAIYLTNNLPYIEKLEFGSSSQSAEGMVRKNMARIEEHLKNRFRES